jgi:hypothetical protein
MNILSEFFRSLFRSRHLPAHQQYGVSTGKYGPMKTQLIELLHEYGYTECSDVLNFLDFFCTPNIEPVEAIYIREKLKICLLNHDNGGSYFANMKLAFEIIDSVNSPSYRKSLMSDQTQ